MRRVARRVLVILALVFAALGVSMATVAMGRAADAPAITTDQPDYLPGSTVNYTATGFEPGEVVDLVAVGSADGVTITAQSTADSAGGFSGSFDLPYLPEPSYTLTATGESSGLSATTTFLDRTITVTVNPTSWTEGNNAAPTALATFTDSSSTPNLVYSVTVSWGDGSPNALLSVSNPPAPTGCAGRCTYTVGGAAHTYADEGSYTITVTVSASNPPATSGTGTGTATVSDAGITIGGGSIPAQTEGVSSGTIVLTPFTDANSLATAADWTATVNWGDGSATESATVSSTGTAGHFEATGSHTYTEEGTKTLTVTVFDSGVQKGSVTTHVTVSDAALHATAGSNISATEGAVVNQATVATFTDDDPNGAAGDYTATINWGDGTGTSNGSISNPSAGHFAVTGSHIYTDELPSGSAHTVSVTINDSGGSQATASLLATVGDAQINVSAGPGISAVEGQSTGAQTVASIADGNPGASASDFTATIDWGDGTSPSTGTVQGAGGVFTVSGAHTYAEELPSAATITVSVSDDGGQTGSAALFATSGDAPLSLQSGNNSFSGTEGAPTSSSAVLASFTDADPGGTASDYSALVSWGDSTQSTAAVVAAGGGVFNVIGGHDYTEAGTYGATITINDAVSTLNTAATFTIADASLSVSPGSGISATEGISTGTRTLAVVHDANPAATAADLSAHVTWGDGSSGSAAVNPTAGGFLVQASHTYAEENATGFPVSVTVTDDDGATGGASLTAVVADGALAATPHGSLTATEGAGTGTINALAQFSDADPAGTTGDYSVTVDWGDGSAPDTTATVVSIGGGSFAVNSAGHSFLDEGSFSATVTITDVGGSATSATVPVTVGDAALSSLITAPLTAVEGAPTGTVTVSSFSDANAGAQAGDFTASIDWGDSTPVTTGTVVASGGQFLVQGSHTYAEEGSFAVAVSITDDGGSTLTQGVGMTVSDAAIALSAGTSFSATEGQLTPVLTLATLTDADPNGTAADYATTINWGDGSFSPGAVVADAGHFDITNQHTYAEAGVYQISVVATDAGPTKGVGGSTATVGDAALHATAGASISAVEGMSTPALVVATFTDDNLGGPASDFTATITWGDGSTSNGAVSGPGGATGFSVIASHAFLEEGLHSVGVSIVDDDGSTVGVTVPAIVSDAPLVVTAGANITPTEGSSTGTVTLATFTDGDPNGTLGDYTATVTWGDGSLPEPAAVSSPSPGQFTVTSAGHTYADEGAHTVTVDIYDAGGASAETALAATVGDAALLRTAVPTLGATEGQPSAPLVLAGFSDTNPAGTAADFTATVNWGDGSALDTSAVVQLVGGTTFNVVSPGHTYAEEGLYTVTVTVQDDGGSSLVLQPEADVVDAPLHATATSISPTEGTQFNGTVATFVDLDPNGTATQYHATINWGDGATSAGTVLSMLNGSFPVTGQHTYAEEGSYTVSVTVHDDGGAADNASAPITVGDAALHIATAPNISAVEGHLYSATIATFTDDDPAGTAGDYSAIVQWGDGSFSGASIVADGGGFDVVSEHTYADEGAFPVNVSIQDHGAQVSADLTAVASDAPLTLTAVPGVIATEGLSSGSLTLAQLSDGNPVASAQDFTATVSWGDGTTSPASLGLLTSAGFPVNASHTYAEEGAYTIHVSVNDDGGQVAQATVPMTVADAALHLIAAPNMTLTEGQATATAPLATLTDADPAGAAGDYTATVDWGDGTGPQPAVVTGSGTFAVSSAAHTYTEEGLYTITVSVLDQGSSSTTTTLSAHILDAALAAPAPSLTAVEGAPTGAVTVTRITDQNPFAGAGDFAATVKWGDGSTDAATIGTRAGDGTFPVIAPSHVYTEAGSNTVEVDINDDGGTVIQAVGSATVADAALTATNGSTLHTFIGNPTGTDTTATFSDADPGGAATDYAATIDWGDGTATTNGTVTGTGPFSVTSPGHTYGALGTYSVTTTIVDEGRSMANATQTVFVGPIPVSITNLVATPSPTEFTDTATLSATLTPANTLGGTLTGSVVFQVNGKPVGGTAPVTVSSTAASVPVTTTLTLDQSIVPPGAGSYSLTAIFTSTNPNYANQTSSAPNVVSVTQEPVSLNYSGDWFVLDTATPHLSVLVDQSAGGMDPGWVDYSKVSVSVRFSIYNGGGSLVQGPFTVPVVNASNWSTTGLGSAQANGSGPLSQDGSYQVVAQLVTNGYVAGPDTQAVLTSSPATGSFITGGGFIDPDSTANSPDSNHHGNFGITVKFNKSLTNLQGNALYIYRMYMDVTTGAACSSPGGPNCRDVDVVVKSNSLTYLSVSQATSTTGSGVITGKFSVQYNDAITGQQYTQLGFGNGTFQVNVVDGGSGGANDQYAGAFRRSDGTVFHLSSGTSTNSTGSAPLVSIKQGNITVHQ